MNGTQYNETKAAVCRQMVEGVYLGIAAFFRGDPKYSTADGYIIRPEQEKWLITHLNDTDIPAQEVSVIIECFAQTSAVNSVDVLIEFVKNEGHKKELRYQAARAISQIDSEDHRKILLELRNQSYDEMQSLFDISLNPVDESSSSSSSKESSLLERAWRRIKYMFS